MRQFLPPGRGLWAMGTAITEDRKLFAALNNCAFVSTQDMAGGGGGGGIGDGGGSSSSISSASAVEPFCFLMDASMLGVGVGFDTKGAGTVVVLGPDTSIPVVTMTVDDSREGFVDAMRCLLKSHLVPLQVSADTDKARTTGTARTVGTTGVAGEAGKAGGSNIDGNGNGNGGVGGSGRGVVEFDYSQVRAAGLPIKGFGGTSSGSGPLRALLEDTHDVLHRRRGQTLSVTCIVDIMNMIGRCVVSGNVRRTAEIAFGDPDSEEYIDLKV